MTPLNYNHLFYFYIIASEGSVVKASQRLHLKPQTLSGQLTAFEQQLSAKLFDRIGKKLILTEVGRVVLGYAEEIFQIGDELKTVLRHQHTVRKTLTVGVTDVIPKALAYQLLSPLLDLPEAIKLICHEGNLQSLLADFSVNKLDLVISDQAMQSGSYIKSYSHQLAESGFTFFAAEKLLNDIEKSFPQSLNNLNFLLQGKNSSIRQDLLSWFDLKQLSPNIIAEFDDSALIKAFAFEGYGVFAAPTIIEESIISQYDFSILGRTTDFKERYYVILHERKVKHPAIVEILKQVNKVDSQRE